jgi:dienelactone hydrolase
MARCGLGVGVEAVVMTHGTFAADFTAEQIFATPLLRRDVHVYAVAAPYHMTRAPAHSVYSGQFLLSGDIPRFVAGLIQAEADVRALVKRFRASDYESVYLSGISLGGNVAAQALTIADVDGAVLFIPAVDFAEIIDRAPIARGTRRAALDAGFTTPEMREALRTVTPQELGDPVPGTSSVTVSYGRFDGQMSADTVEALLRAWDGPNATVYPAGHRTMGLRVFSLRDQLAGWLDAQRYRRMIP